MFFFGGRFVFLCSASLLLAKGCKQKVELAYFLCGCARLSAGRRGQLEGSDSVWPKKAKSRMAVRVARVQALKDEAMESAIRR